MSDKNNNSKILFIGPYPPPYSGPEMGMKLFLESSLKDDFQIHFLKTNFRKTNTYKGRFDIYMVLAYFVFIFKLFTMIIRYRPVLTYYPITPTQIGWIGRDFWCLSICKLFKIKTIIHLRGGHFKLNFQTFNSFVKKIIQFSIKSVSMVIVQANCLRDQFQGLVKKEKVQVLYNAINITEYSNDNLKNYNPHQILFMGHMTKAKGYCDIIRTIPIVAERFPEIKFIFAGTLRKSERGVFFNQLTGNSIRYEDPFEMHNSILSGKYNKNYVNLNLVYGNDKIDLLKNTNIFILPSYSEGFSLSILEAMCMGKPVVCTPVGAHKEVIQNKINGLIIEPGNIKQLAESIILLLEDVDLRNHIAQTNYNFVRNTFSIDIIAHQMKKLINSVIYD